MVDMTNIYGSRLVICMLKLDNRYTKPFFCFLNNNKEKEGQRILAEKRNDLNKEYLKRHL